MRDGLIKDRVRGKRTIRQDPNHQDRQMNSPDRLMNIQDRRMNIQDHHAITRIIPMVLVPREREGKFMG